MKFYSSILAAVLAIVCPAWAQQATSIASGQGQVTPISAAKTVTIAVKNAALRDVITEIARQSGLRVSYPEGLISAQPRVSLQLSAASAEIALDKAIARTDLKAVRTGPGEITLRSVDQR